VIDNTNQRNAQFYELIFNFWCLPYVSNLVGSSSGRQLYLQYGMFYMHRYEQSVGQESVLSIIYKIVHFIDLWCIIVSQCAVQKKKNIKFQWYCTIFGIKHRLDFVINFQARTAFSLREECVTAIQWARKHNAFNFILNPNDGQGGWDGCSM
jgi:hypothetical protein